MTFYFEGRIVIELKRRKASTDSEQLKIDYRKMTYRNELENLPFIYSLPINTQTKLTIPEKNKDLASSELTLLIK